MKIGAKLGIAALVVALVCLRLWFRAIAQVELPEDRTAYFIAFLTAAALGISAFIKGPGRIGGLAAIPAIVIGLFFPFTVSISEQILPPNAIQVGETIPNFSAPDDRGELFDSAQLRGNPVLIKFFRAHW